MNNPVKENLPSILKPLMIVSLLSGILYNYGFCIYNGIPFSYLSINDIIYDSIMLVPYTAIGFTIALFSKKLNSNKNNYISLKINFSTVIMISIILVILSGGYLILSYINDNYHHPAIYLLSIAVLFNIVLLLLPCGNLYILQCCVVLTLLFTLVGAKNGLSFYPTQKISITPRGNISFVDGILLRILDKGILIRVKEDNFRLLAPLPSPDEMLMEYKLGIKANRVDPKDAPVVKINLTQFIRWDKIEDISYEGAYSSLKRAYY